MPRPPPFRRLAREWASFPRIMVNPLRRPRPGKSIGKGRPALVIPGLTTGDISTVLLRRTLKGRDFVPEGWGLGINTGADPAKLRKLEQRIALLHEESGKKVLLIGWSLGGMYARVLGHRCAEHLDMVITVASPFSGDRRANNAWRLYEALNDHSVDDAPFGEDISVKPPVPTIAVWSAIDGVIAPECTRGGEGQADHWLQIDMSHFALGTSRTAIERLLEKLAEVDGERG